MKTYSELRKLKTFDERLKYLKTNSMVGEETFGYSRYLNQVLYQSPEWKHIRKEVILRDKGCDLGIEGYEIGGKIIVHHINAITLEDIEKRNPKVYDMNNLITVSDQTHRAIHYGMDISFMEPVERKPNDQCPWRN